MPAKQATQAPRTAAINAAVAAEMSPQRTPASLRSVQRHGPFFQGWAQSFGAHQRIDDPIEGQRWLIAEGQLGLILTDSLRARLDPTVLGQHADAPPPGTDPLKLPWLGVIDSEAPQVTAHLAVLANALFEAGAALHLYQTYHLIYPAGTRILTLSTQAPMALIYRQLEPLRLSSPTDKAITRAGAAD